MWHTAERETFRNFFFLKYNKNIIQNVQQVHKL